MPPVNPQVETINETVGKINKAVSGLGQGLTQLPTISADQLKNTQAKFDVTQPTPSASDVGFQSQLEAQADAFTQNLENKASVSGEKATSSFEDYLAAELGTPGLTELTADAEEKFGVTEIEKELKDINQQILVEQQGLVRQLEELDKNAQGFFGGGLEIEKEKVRKESLRKQADLTIIQMGIQGRFDSAKAIADRAVQIQFDKQERRNEALKANYERNQALFTEDEKRAFETAQADRERKLTEEKENRQKISDLSIDALQNGAPTSVITAMRQADTVDEALKIGGSYVGRLDRQIKEASLRAQDIANSKAQAELEALENPDPNAVDALTLEEIKDLSDGARGDLVLANKTANQLDRLIEIINNEDKIEFLNPTTNLGREFNRIAKDVADQMARERTGAVVNPSEEKTFKQILGLSFGTQLLDDTQKLTETLSNYKNGFNQEASLIDPTGRIRNYLEETSPYGQTTVTADSYLDTIFGGNGFGQDVYSPYIN